MRRATLILVTLSILLALSAGGAGRANASGIPIGLPHDLAEAIRSLEDAIRAPGACADADARCAKLRRALEARLLRIEEATDAALAMKLAGGVVKKAARLEKAGFSPDWLNDLRLSIAALATAAESIGALDIQLLEDFVDPYGSPLARFASRIEKLSRKESLASGLRAEGSLRSLAKYLGKISALHRAALKLEGAIKRFIDKSGLVVVPESDFSVPLYENSLATPADVEGWVMEGPGELEFRDSWMEMQDPRRQGHHVLWCPVELPATFAAEWELQNLNPDAGLLIVFFAARGKNDVGIFDPSLRRRTGDFDGYIKGDINNYHISYYANNPRNPSRTRSRLRKNSGFKLLQSGDPGIPPDSTAVHQVRIIKDGNRIKMFIDGREIIDYTDLKAPLGGGKIGFRQMQWSHFRYRNLRVWGAR